MSIQALVFDLDDTLMDTHGQLVPEAHRQACLAMQQAGLDIPLKDLLQARLDFIKRQPRADVNALLASHFQAAHPEKVAAAGAFAFYNPQITTLAPFPGVPEMLAKLQHNYLLFLVTSGYPAPQAAKIEALGIGKFFREICYIPIEQINGKREAFATLSQKYALPYAQMLIIGDRITNEIVHGNHLGCPTLWLQGGECAHILPQSPQETPNWTLQHISELPSILESQFAGIKP